MNFYMTDIFEAVSDSPEQDTAGSEAKSPPEEAGVLTCQGSEDTRKYTQANYATITWDAVLTMVVNPAARAKTEAPAAIPSTYHAWDGRGHQVQRQNGSFIWLAGDVDKGNTDKSRLVEALLSIAGGACDAAIYSTASSKQDDRRWRFLLRLASPVKGEDYADVQKALFSLLEDRGILVDWTLSRTGQLFYLPNVPLDRRDANGIPLFYDYAILPGGVLDIHKTQIPLRMAERSAQEAAKLAELRAEAEARARARAHRQAHGVSHEERLIDRYNSENRVEAVLTRYGFRQNRKGDWQSPYQALGSGGYATRVFGDRFFTFSASDCNAGLGQPGKNGGRWGDAWDLYRHFEHKNDHHSAFRTYGRHLRGAAFSEMRAEDYVDETAAKARRDQQRAENQDIGAEQPFSTVPERLSLDMALARFVLATQGSYVVDLSCPTRGYALPEFRTAFAASKETAHVTNRKTGELEEKEMPVTTLWLASPQRHTVHTRTFKPGHKAFTVDPAGLPSVNTWRPYHRTEPSAFYKEHTGAFEHHVRYLFGDDADGFLDWLSHIEQQPGVLPHRAVIHVSQSTGTGRNWISSVLARIWRGHVAASFDLVGTLRSGFNGELSSKLLAIVDEIREGARADAWEFSETMKKLITEERRTVNFKYGQQITEFNCCRFLLFSNSPAAIPLGKGDRRFDVTVFEGDPQPESYYTQLYRLLGDPAFINDVALWLRDRDINTFNPGARARQSAGKDRVILATEPESSTYARAVVDHWPSDVIANAVLSQLIDPRAAGTLSPLVRAAAAEVGMRPGARPVWSGKGNVRVHIVRNAARWLGESGASVASEMRRGVPATPGFERDWRDWLDGIAREASDFG